MNGWNIAGNFTFYSFSNEVTIKISWVTTVHCLTLEITTNQQTYTVMKEQERVDLGAVFIRMSHFFRTPSLLQYLKYHMVLFGAACSFQSYYSYLEELDLLREPITYPTHTRL